MAPIEETLAAPAAISEEALVQTTTDFFQYHISDGIATITFDRPDKLNAFTRGMVAELILLLDQVDADDDARALILTGAGRAFCAGADLQASDSALASRPGGTGAGRADATGDATAGTTGAKTGGTTGTPRDFGGLLTLRMFESVKPIIVAFNGPAAGMGVTLALAADMRLASTAAKFTLPFARRGIIPESASAWFLPRIVGIAQALEWTMTGRTFSAQEALAGGLVRSLHEPLDLLPAARALALEIAANTAPVSVALTRQLLWRMLSADHPMRAHQWDSRCLQSRIQSSDVREGVASFLEKRPPHFHDRVSVDMPSFYPWWETPEF
jgi:enoyl-CoA hydratase/carnithine racemase